MTPEEAVKMIKAKLDCMCREFSGIDEDCNTSNCDNCRLNYEQGTVGEQMEALRVAISALQTRRCATCKHDPPSKKWPCLDCDMRDPADRWEQRDAGDTISRQAAIDALDEIRHVLDRKEKELTILPSAQREPCEDVVSRSDAILAIQRHGVGCYNAEYFSPEQSERYVINLLKSLPAAGSK